MKNPDKLSTIMKFFDEAVATKPRQRILSILCCGIGATIFGTGIMIGTTKVSEEERVEEKTE